jgi:DeoR/GlpR family transcriptional regulator of sugar metabolism
MLSPERQNRILDHIRAHRSVQVSELSTTFNVSLSTVRRDLEQLEENGFIQRVHGGAVLVEDTAELPILLRASQQAQYKQRIAGAAAKLVEDGDTILVTGGTTTTAMVPFLAGKADLTVITNSLNCAHKLARYPSVAVVVLGGWLRHAELSLLGHLIEYALQELRPGKTFHSVFGINPEDGLTGTDLQEVRTDRCLIAAAPQLIILADHTKFNQTGPVVLAPVTAASVVVTDTESPAADVQALRDLGVEVIRA